MLPAKTLKEVRGMNVDDRTRYFETHARYFADTPPTARYAIRVGPHTLFADDTEKLRQLFDQAVRRGKH